MTCDQTTSLLSDRLSGQLSDDDERQLDAHLAGCAACRAEAEAVTEMWNDMDGAAIAVPHERMRARFHAALAAYDERSQTSFAERLVRLLWPQRPALQLGAAASLLVVGVFIGLFMNMFGEAGVGQGSRSSVEDDIAALREDLSLVAVALLGHQSATERLRGVDWLQRAPATAGVTDALLEVVRNDRSVNVRLAAVEALAAQMSSPDVSAGLSDAFDREQTPLMQVTLAEVLLRGGAAESREHVQRFIEQDEVDVSVRDYLQAVMQSTEQSAQQEQFL